MKDDIYILSAPMTLNNLKQWMWTMTANTDQPLLENFHMKSNTVLMHAGKYMGHILNCVRNEKKNSVLIALYSGVH
jgi:hypothetical protein